VPLLREDRAIVGERSKRSFDDDFLDTPDLDHPHLNTDVVCIHLVAS
jgi:hypothetical protein